jgi:hypothetical protein
VILDLRVVLLSGVWHRVYRAAVSTYQDQLPQTLNTHTSPRERKAA